jgi:hypothetical protein
VKALLRSLIVWLALLAAPFQGFASAAMPTCAAAVHVHQASATSHHAHEQTRRAHHGEACKQSPHHAKCSNCAACCAGAAIVSSFTAVAAPHASVTTAIPFDACQPPSVDLDDPERPPRFLRT